MLLKVVANRTHHTASKRVWSSYSSPYPVCLVTGAGVHANWLRMLLFFIRRCITISTKELLINDEIKAKEVRLVGEDGQQLGIMSLSDAKEYAYSRDLDLVLMSATAVPPACRAMNYGKYRFERDKREKEAKKKQQISKLKEVQLSCRIDVHDFETRVNHAKSFLRDGNKVKAVVRFKGREMAHKELGEEVLRKFMDACRDFGVSEKGLSLEGRFMSVVLSPLKATPAKKQETQDN